LGVGKYKITKNKKFYEQVNLQLDISKAKKILKWKPKLSIPKSIELTVEWYKSVLNNKKNCEEITESQIKSFLGTDYL
jgi:CDP-glucose 4,6-dehydratase